MELTIENITAVADVVGAPAFAVLCCFGIVGFALYKILPRLKQTDDIKADRERKQKEYADRFAELDKRIVAEASARQALENLVTQRLDQGDGQFRALESKFDELQRSVGKVGEGVANLSGKIEMFIKIKGA